MRPMQARMKDLLCTVGFTLLVAAPLCACASPSRPAPPPVNKAATAIPPTEATTTAALVGRWILAPGDCVMPQTEDASAQPSTDTIVSPAGAVLVLASGGTMFAHQGEFIRKGTWKFDGTSLRIVVEPPPRRIEMGFAPTIEGSQLTLTGTDKMVLVYHRDPFVAVPAAVTPPSSP